MQLNRLTLNQFRAFEEATFNFYPGMNLIVGINGVGKSTVLDAIRIAFSRVQYDFTVSRDSRLNISLDDIMIGQDSSKIELEFTTSGVPFEYSVGRAKRGWAELKPDNPSILETLKNSKEQPLVLYFATRRSIVTSGREVNKEMAEGDQSVAFFEALKPRMLRLQDFTDWWLVQKALADEGLFKARVRLSALQDTITTFLEWCTNLRVVKYSENKSSILLEKNGVTLDIYQLSEGERGTLALVLDLARRLTQANPELEDPLTEGKALVLIDEIDLHLHPKWQRTVVERLERTFRSCQFIATTHSPQILGEVEPEKIYYLEAGKQPYRHNQSLGMDSNWILRHLMGGSERNKETDEDLERIMNLIQERHLKEATEGIRVLRERLRGPTPNTVRLQTRIDRIKRLGR